MDGLNELTEKEDREKFQGLLARAVRRQQRARIGNTEIDLEMAKEFALEVGLVQGPLGGISDDNPVVETISQLGEFREGEVIPHELCFSYVQEAWRYYYVELLKRTQFTCWTGVPDHEFVGSDPNAEDNI